jgi:hypothetical protein
MEQEFGQRFDGRMHCLRFSSQSSYAAQSALDVQEEDLPGEEKDPEGLTQREL